MKRDEGEEKAVDRKKLEILWQIKKNDGKMRGFWLLDLPRSPLFFKVIGTIPDRSRKHAPLLVNFGFHDSKSQVIMNNEQMNNNNK